MTNLFSRTPMILKEIKLDGLTGQIAALELGTASGLPIVAIHGWLDNAASFEPLARYLNQYRWICLDLPGHGRSDYRPDGCIYHFTDYVADLFSVVESLGLDRFILVGHSLGAGIASTFAAVFPGKVDRLVLIDGIGPLSGEDDDSLCQLRKSMAFLEIRNDNAARVYGSWDGLVSKRLQAGKINRNSAEMRLRRGTVREGETVTVLSDGRLKQQSPIYMSQDKVISILKGIRAPTRLILADQGLLVSHESTGARIDALQNLQVVKVRGGHHLHMDCPEEVAREIETFLTQGR